MTTILALLLDPNGRIDRGQFWKGYGIWLAVAAVLAALLVVWSYAPAAIAPLSWAALIPILALLWAAWMLSIKRLRDSGVSPWWLLLIFIPFIGPLAGLVIFVICGVQAGVPPRTQYDGVERID